MDIKSKEKIRSLNPTKEVVQEVITLKGNLGKCTKHNDNNPSFSVHPEKGICQCFAGCTNGSLDVFGFCEWWYGNIFHQALERLATRAGILIKTSEKKNYKKDPYKEIRDFLMRDGRDVY
jgi:DNA primase